MEARAAARTHQGLVRRVNEDAHLVVPPLFCVADGMGGHANGAFASGLVVEEFRRRFAAPDQELAEGLGPESDQQVGPVFTARSGADAVLGVLSRAQSRLRSYTEAQSGFGQRIHAGTTVVVALACWEEGRAHWLIANLGDSRAYGLHEGVLTQLTTDHSVVQELQAIGRISAAEAETHPERHVITRAVGANLDALHPDFFLVPMAESRRLVLCTDGVSSMIGAEELAAIARESTAPKAAADRLIDAALAAGGRDNATAIVIDVAPSADPEPSAAGVKIVRQRGRTPGPDQA